MKTKGVKKWCCVAGLAIGVLAFTGCDGTKEPDETEQKINVIQEETEESEMEEENGFSSYAMGADTGNQIDAIDAELAEIEAKSKEMEEQLGSGILNQIELNSLSADWYKLWDDEINSIWTRLKETLDEETFAALKEEQLSWIAYKESEVAAAGEEYAGGSMRPLEENTLAAEMTRERVYELIELLR